MHDQDTDDTEKTNVLDDEIVYRSIQCLPQFFRWGADNEIRVSASAFNDRNFEPSFYRKNLCASPPNSNPPRMNPGDAVAQALTGAIRRQNAISFQSGGEPKPTEYQVDVRPETNGQHIAHVVVFTAPHFKTRGGFGKLKELLAQIVGNNWAIRPPEDFLEQIRE